MNLAAACNHSRTAAHCTAPGLLVFLISDSPLSRSVPSEETLRSAQTCDSLLADEYGVHSKRVAIMHHRSSSNKSQTLTVGGSTPRRPLNGVKVVAESSPAKAEKKKESSATH